MTSSDRSFALSTGSFIASSESGGLLRTDSSSESSSVLPYLPAFDFLLAWPMFELFPGQLTLNGPEPMQV